MAEPGFIRPRAKVGPNLIEYDPEDFTIIDELQVEIAVEETHEQSVTWTSKPVEVGSDITDHAVIEQDRYTLTGLISNTPLHAEFESPITPGPDRVAAADQKLTAMLRDRLVIQVLSGLRNYPSMGIESYTVQRNKTNGQALAFTLGLVEIRFAQSETVTIPTTAVRADIAPEAAPQVDAGTQTGTQTTPDQALEGEAAEREDQSVAAGLFDNLGNLSP